MPYKSTVINKLKLIYEDLIWLGNRPHVNPRQARAWYSQIFSRSLARQVRLFTGKVSLATLNDLHGELVLEHYKRLSYELSRLLENHIKNQINDPDKFISLIEMCERVNITTDEENHMVQKNKRRLYQSTNTAFGLGQY